MKKKMWKSVPIEIPTEKELKENTKNWEKLNRVLDKIRKAGSSTTSG